MSMSDQTHKVQNWSEYNEALVDRGRLTVWFGEEAIENWKHDGPAQQGAQWIFTDLAVKTCLQIKVVYGLTLRQTEGFVESLVEMTGLEEQMPVPDYTTLSKRQGDLDVEVQIPKESLVEGGGRSEEEEVHLVIDSTGLKVYGEGEWKQRIHGKQKRRTWRKLHLGVDSDTGEITAVGLTDNTSHDGSQVEKLLDQTSKELSAVGGDGAYDAWDVYDAISDREATPVIPPQRNAKIKKHGNCSGPPLPRDEAIRYIRGHGRKKWKRTHSYHRRSLAETAVYRFKQIMGRFVEARRWENEKVEVRLKAKSLNRMTRLGMPKTSKVAV
jgi:transposase